jgi:NADPH2:quinone reductase
MRRLVVTGFGGPEVLEWQEAPAPQPGPGEVLVRVRAFSIIWADVLERRGTYPGQPQPPFGGGHEFTGVVEAVGPGVDEPRAGTRVFGTVPAGGAGAELVVAPAHILHPVPDEVGDVAAAAMVATYLTAEVGITTFAQLGATDSVLIHAAAGGLGSACLQLCRAHGCGVIVATAGGAEKVARVAGWGADVVVDYTRDDFVVAALEATGRRGVDVVLESVGGDVLGKSFDCLAPAGRLVCMGASSGRSSDRFRLHTLFEKGISIAGFTLGLWIDAREPAVAAAAGRVLALAAEGRIDPVIAAVLAPEQMVEAHALFESRTAIGRIVVSFDAGR